MDKRIVLLLFMCVLFLGAAGCTSNPLDTQTQLKIVDVDPQPVGFTTISTDVTVQNLGKVPAKNVIIGVVKVNKNDLAVVMKENPESLKEVIAEDPEFIKEIVEGNKGDALVDKDYLGNIEPGDYGKGTLVASVNDISDDNSILIKIAIADNAPPAIY